MRTSIAWVLLRFLELRTIRIGGWRNTQWWLRSIRHRLRGRALLWGVLWVWASGLLLRIDVNWLSVIQFRRVSRLWW